jgi:hypothetical protein
MTPLPPTVSDDELLALIDRWASLLELGEYDAAFALTDHLPAFGWSPTLVRETISYCGPYNPDRRVTLGGGPTPGAERKVVSRYREPTEDGYFGEICCYLNIDGEPSDRVATFLLRSSPRGVTVHFEGIK